MTLYDALRAAASADDVTGITLLPDKDGAPAEHRSYARLLADVEKTAGRLERRGVVRGDRVLLVLPTSFELVVAFFAVSHLGAVPVPTYPPFGLEALEPALDRLAHVTNDAGASFCITNRRLRLALGELGLRAPSLREIFAGPAVVTETTEDASRASGIVLPDAQDLAFLQYTSGSTGRPKGVALSHANVIANIRAIGTAVDVTAADRTVSWLPLYHDMGLIGGLLFSITWRLPLVLMSPLAFMMRPWRWLRAISDHEGTLSPAPNFAYALATKRAGEADLRGLDLSSWRLALNGAEPIHHETVRGFAHTFGPYGFRETAMFPVYGLAEASLALTASTPAEPPRFEHLDRTELAGGRAVSVDPTRQDASIVTCVGRPVPGHEIQVTDDDGKPIGDRRVGQVLARGPSIMSGYFRNSEATSLTIRDGWLWTGDLGFLVDGRLYITGREKDLVIVNGHNHHAEDIERVAESVEGVRRGRTVAFAIDHETEGREAVVLVCELNLRSAARGRHPQGASKERDESAERMLAERITEVVRRACSLSLDEVSFVPTGTLPRTSSGKVQRRKTRELYVEEALVPASTSNAALVRVFARSAMGLLTLLRRRVTRRR